MGTLATIEKFEINACKISMIEVQMPMALWRFASLKISDSKILFLGGIERLHWETDAVYCFDLKDELKIEKLDKISRTGIIDLPIVVDKVGNLHLFIENCNGTSPPFDVTYSFLEYS